jgi:hypothetical protein
MTRDEMIDYIEDNYNNGVNYVKLYDIMEDMFGPLNDNGGEGIYSDLEDYELEDLIDELDRQIGVDDGPARPIELSDRERDVLRKAMEDFSDPAFTKDFEMSRIARNILRKLSI